MVLTHGINPPTGRWQEPQRQGRAAIIRRPANLEPEKNSRFRRSEAWDSRQPRCTAQMTLGTAQMTVPGAFIPCAVGHGAGWRGHGRLASYGWTTSPPGFQVGPALPGWRRRRPLLPTETIPGGSRSTCSRQYRTRRLQPLRGRRVRRAEVCPRMVRNLARRVRCCAPIWHTFVSRSNSSR